MINKQEIINLYLEGKSYRQIKSLTGVFISRISCLINDNVCPRKSGFQKGHKINVGKLCSDKTKNKIGASNKGHLVSVDARKKISIKKKGKPNIKLSIIRKQMFASGELINPNKGKPSPSTTKRNLENNPMKNPETRKKNSISNSGKNAYRWKGGPKLASIRQQSRRRLLGYIPLNQEFDGCEGHHIDKEHVVYIPKELHRSVWHSLNKLETMEQINTKVFCWLLCQS